MKDPKKENNKPEEDNRLIELADEELDSVTGSNGKILYDVPDPDYDIDFYGSLGSFDHPQ